MYAKASDLKMAAIGYASAFNMGNAHLTEAAKAGMVPTAVCEIVPERLVAAYVLVDALRRHALAGTDLVAAQAGTIRLKVFKVAARVIVSVRRVLLHLASSYSLQALWRQMLERPVPAGPGLQPSG